MWTGVQSAVVTADPGYVAFVTHHQDVLRRTAFLLCGDRHLAEDLLQDAFVKLAMSWESVQHPAAYVRRILYRDTISMWRKRRREKPVDAVPEASATSKDPAAVSDTQMVVRDLLQSLPRRQRAALVLRYFEDLTEAQAAEVMGVSVGTVKSLAHQGKRRMREALDEPGQDARPENLRRTGDIA